MPRLASRKISKANIPKHKNRHTSSANVGGGLDVLLKTLDVIRERLLARCADLRSAFQSTDQQGKGYLSHADFNTLLATSKIKLSPVEEEILFNFFDENNDGKIQLSEFRDVLRLGNENERQERSSTKEAVLQDMKGRVVQLEMKLEERFRSLRKAFRSIDKDHNGSVEWSEVAQLLRGLNLNPRGEVYKAFFSLADSNNDGKIDYDEFAKAFGIILQPSAQGGVSAKIVDRAYLENRLHRGENSFSTFAHNKPKSAKNVTRQGSLNLPINHVVSNIKQTWGQLVQSVASTRVDASGCVPLGVLYSSCEKHALGLDTDSMSKLLAEAIESSKQNALSETSSPGAFDTVPIPAGKAVAVAKKAVKKQLQILSKATTKMKSLGHNSEKNVFLPVESILRVLNQAGVNFTRKQLGEIVAAGRFRNATPSRLAGKQWSRIALGSSRSSNPGSLTYRKRVVSEADNRLRLLVHRSWRSIEAKFKHMNRNKRKKHLINAAELNKVLSAHGVLLPLDELKPIFARLDSKKEGL